MTEESQDSLPLIFRQTEVSQIFTWIKAGESCLVIGVSGVGKSNLFNHLLDPHVQEAHLGKHAKDYFFIRVNFHFLPDFNPPNIYSLILEHIELLEEEGDRLGLASETISLINQKHEELLNSGSDILKVQYYFKAAIRLLLKDSQKHLVLLFDQFDDVYRAANPLLFSNLRGLRESYKYRISYVVFTRNTLSSIALDAAREEFHELLATNILGLKPYVLADAELLLTRIARRHQLQLDQVLIAQLYQLTSGHAGLLRSLYLTLGQQPTAFSSQAIAVERLLQIPSILEECLKLWNSVTFLEQTALIHQVRHWQGGQLQQQAEEVLRLKGLIINSADGPIVFCPLFEAYLTKQPGAWDQLLWLDSQSGKVWVRGERLEPDLTQLEFRLLNILYQRRGEICSQEYIVQQVWSEEYEHTQGTIDDQRLVQLIKRLRNRIEPKEGLSRFIENVRGRGYRLNLPE